MILKILINIWRFVFILDVLIFFYITKECTKYLNTFFDARDVDIKIVNHVGQAVPILQILIMSAIPIFNIVLGAVWIFNYNDFIKSVLVKMNDKLLRMELITDELHEEFLNKITRDFD